MHEYTVEFRIEVPGSSVNQISDQLGLPPSHTRFEKEKGYSIWGFNGSNDSERLPVWNDLSEGILFVAKRLEPQLPLIRRFISVYRCYWWCGHFHSGFDGGPTLLPNVLTKLASIGAEVYIDTYHSDECSSGPAI